METREMLEKLQRGEMYRGGRRRDICAGSPLRRWVTPSWICTEKSVPVSRRLFSAPARSDEHLLQIFRKLYETDGEVFGTRASQHQYELIREGIPPGWSMIRPSHIIKIEKKEKERIGNVAVCTAGTADIPWRRKRPRTAEYFGTNVPSDLRCGGQPESTGCFPDWMWHPGGQLCCGGGRHGGSAGQRDGRSGG